MKTNLTEKWIVCRVCLQQPEEVMTPIFDKDDDKDMTQMILECGGVPIQRFDHYPNKICGKCLKYLRVAHTFRVTCQHSHKHLSKFIAPAVVESAVVEESNDIVPVEVDEEEINLKVEPDDSDSTQEYDDTEEVLDIYVPIDDDIEEFKEFDNIDRPGSEVSDDVEYLEEVNDEFQYSDDGDYIQIKGKSEHKSRRGRPPKKTNTSKSAASVSQCNKMQKSPSKRGPKPKKKPTSYICYICPNIYPSQRLLTEHLKQHKSIRPRYCEICGHRFAYTQQLTVHMNTHTGNRPYKCTYCPAAFADMSTRNKHHLIHTGERPHVCDICGKAFRQAYKLRNHKKIHARKGEIAVVTEKKAEPVELIQVEIYQGDDNATVKRFHVAENATTHVFQEQDESESQDFQEQDEHNVDGQVIELLTELL
ncbi:zinc finger protein 287-like [Eurosta solidaginis]|uniref:zinc finger protein 287-like n=1 Tax=Eurosta solidaginis TaxID=178769 RepID=UPI003530B434